MNLKNLFECVKCFLIGNHKANDSCIDDHLYPSDYLHDMYRQNYGVHSTPLYTPPNEDIEVAIKEGHMDEYNHSHTNAEQFQENITSIQNEQDINHVFKNMSEIIVELDIIKQKLASDETKQIITFCQDKIIEGLSSSGALLLEKEESYSNARHYPVPFGIYPEGCSIKRIIRPGVIVHNEVLLKALVEL